MIADIEAALEERVQALASEPLVAWWGRTFSPTVGVPYLAAQILARAKAPIAVGANSPEVWDGTLSLVVAHPMSEGPKAARARAEAVEAHFPRGLTLVKNAVRLTVLSRTVPPPMSTIDWLNYPVLIGWFCEEIPA